VHQAALVRLEAGRSAVEFATALSYALLCFLPDDDSVHSHLHQGMAYPFSVGA
jgi:hypothetical protein